MRLMCSRALFRFAAKFVKDGASGGLFGVIGGSSSGIRDKKVGNCRICSDAVGGTDFHHR